MMPDEVLAALRRDGFLTPAELVEALRREGFRADRDLTVGQPTLAEVVEGLRTDGLVPTSADPPGSRRAADLARMRRNRPESRR